MQIIKNRSRLPALVDDHEGMNRTRFGMPWIDGNRDPFVFESVDNELGEVIRAESAGVHAFRAEPSRGYECRSCQASALTFLPLDWDLGIGARIGCNVQQLIDRDAAEAQKSKAGSILGCVFWFPGGQAVKVPGRSGS